MNALQAQVISMHPVLYDCVCHVREDKTFEAPDANDEIVTISQRLRDLSDTLRMTMEK